MLKKVTEKIKKVQMPKKYRQYTDEEILKEYNEMRQELAGLSKDPDYDGEMLLQFLQKNEDLIGAVEVLEKRCFEEKLSEK